MTSTKGAPELPENQAPDDDVISLKDEVEPINQQLAADIQAEESPAATEPAEKPAAEETPEPEPDSTPEPEPAPEPESPEDPPKPLDDPALDEAVDDIVAEESTAVLEAEDEARDRENEPAKPAKAESAIGAFIKKIWRNPASRWGVLGGGFVLILLLAIIPTTRYFILNTAQVRASLEVTVIDSGTLQPLKNVTVKAANAEAKTNSDGFAKLEDVRLGRTTLTIEKRAFSPMSRPITVGWGSNKQGEYRAIAIGTQYTFFVKDFLSEQPLERVEAASGDGNASSDKDGKIVLTLDTADMDDSAQVSVDFTLDSYRTETLNLTVNNRETQEIQMVPARKHVFVTKRTGTYDVYAVDVDGKNEERIVGGTGKERDDIALVPHPTKDIFAYVATRENARNHSGYLLSTIYIVDIKTKDIMKIDQSEQIQIIGWSDNDRLVYAKVAAGASGTDPKRHRLISFNNSDYGDVKELASSNSFNDVLMADDRVYYAPSNMFNEAEPAVFSVKPDGSDSRKILEKEAFNVLRTGFDTLALNTGDKWYDYTLGSPMAAEAQEPSSLNSRVYAENPADNFSLWVDKRDGKGVLLSYDHAEKSESVLVERGGLKLPVHWLGDKYIVYRVADGRETADYIMSFEGGEPRKITDVTDTSGINRWFYY